MHEIIEQKFQKLEKEVKKLRIFNTILILVVSSFVLFGFQQKIKLPDFELPSIIEAEKFVIKGKNGKLAELSMIDDNNAALIFYKDNGNKLSLNLGISENNAFINIPGESANKFLINETKNNAFIYLGSDLKDGENFIQLDPNTNSPFISLKNSKGNFTYLNNNGTKIIKDSLFMMYGKDYAFDFKDNNTNIVDLPGSYGVNVYKAVNNERQFYYSSGYEPNNKNSYVELYNPLSNSTASMKVINNFPGIVGIKDNQLRYLLFVDENNKTSYKTYDETGKLRSVIGSESLNVNGVEKKTEESSILLFDKDGKVIEQFPKNK